MVGEPDERRRCVSGVSAVAVAKSGPVLYLFRHLYLPFYGKDDRFLVRHYAVFGWLSAFVYDADEQIEAGEAVPEALSRLDELAAYLSSFVPLDPPLLELFDDARRYYRFEHEVTRHGGTYSLDDLVRMTRIRSFDFRLLHRALAHLAGVPCREELFAWFEAFEMMVEVEDDLCSVEEDFRRETFNAACLAERRAPGEGLAFVDHLRRDIEAELGRRAESLTGPDRRQAAAALAFYREVSVRPEIPASLPGAPEPTAV
jgi:hypothetical protein